MAAAAHPGSRVRVTFTLASEDVERLERLASSLSISTTEVVRRAIADELFLQEHVAAGGTVIVRDATGHYREIEMR